MFSSSPRSARCILAVLGIFALSALDTVVFGQDVLITEFLSVNDSSIVDEDGDSSDWIEVQNIDGVDVNLDGWFLTDEEAVPEKWAFPRVILGPGDFVVVFASGKDRANTGEELHTNFGLSSAGEYLAIVRPNGDVAHQYAPTFPRQRDDVSYGITQDVNQVSFVSEGSIARYLIPANGTLGFDWIERGFNDNAWDTGPTGLGHDSGAAVDPNPGGPENLALGGTASQSSQLGGFSADLAIDGDIGNFTHTASGNNLPATWELDLGALSPIESIVIYNRQSCCVSRLRDITVFVLDDDDEIVYESELLNPENVLDGPGSLTVDFLDELGASVQGQIVRIVRTPDPDLSGGAGNGDEADVLSLGEVEVWKGSSGFNSHIATDLTDEMLDVRATAYARFEFDVDDFDAFEVMLLRMKYDDGFVAYLNGEEVASSNAPASLSWSSSATRERSDVDAVTFEEFNLSDRVDLLRATGNVLAIHGLNRSASDDDFLLTAELSGLSFVQDVPRYFNTPTPGAPNDASGVIGFVADTTFSVDRGFFSAPISVALATATEGATIRYTEDGSAPTASRGRIYSDPITINQTTILRAAAFLDGFEPTNVDTQTYFFLDDVIDSNVMRTSITRHATYGPQMEASLMDLPSISLVTSGTVNKTSEVGVSMEWIDPDGGSEFQENAGIKLFGGNHTNFAKKNFRVYFRSEYGAGKLKFPAFAGHDRTIPAAESFDQIELRSGSHDMNQRGFYMSNRFCDDTMLDMGNLNPHGRFVHVYLDGTYWGQYHLRERWHDAMHADYLGGEREDYESINGNDNQGGAFGPGSPYDGDGSTWNRAKSLSNRFVQVSNWVDVQHYIDFMLLFNYGNSETEYRCVGPNTAGSGFKFYLNDADGFTRNVGNRLGVAGPGSIFSGLRGENHPDFKTLLADRIHKHFFNDGAMTADKMRARLLERCDQIERAFYAEAARWDYRTPSNWESTKNSYVNGVMPGRSATVLGYLRDAGLYPSLAAPEFSRHGGEVPAGSGVTVSAPVGEVYTMPDGSDPRLPGGNLAPGAVPAGGINGVTVLSAGDDVRVHVPADGALGLDWTELSFNDASWRAGTTGVGHETGSGYQDLIETDVEDTLHDVNSSIYMRSEFNIDDPAAVAFLVLQVKYDDGFIAYVNGVEAASRNAPENPTWNSRATRSHSDTLAVDFEPVDLSAGIPGLRRGRNVLAIHGLNTTAGGGDFLMVPEVEVAEASGGLIIDESKVLRARARVGGNWSALTEATFVVDLPLRVTELMYNPPAPLVAGQYSANDFEYVEFKNVGDDFIELDGLRIEGGISFDFSTGSVRRLPPGGILLIVSKLEAFRSRYVTPGLLVAGEYSGQLSNGSDRIEIRGRVNEVVLGFEYSDLWHPITDGQGLSLVHIDPLMERDSWGLEESWQPSEEVLGTPGVDDTGDPMFGGWQLIGDSNQDASVDLSDGITLLRRLFIDGGAVLPCEGELTEGGNIALHDVNGDAEVDVSDAIYLLEYLFLGGTPPTLGVGCVRVEGCPDSCF